jgi:(S)-sulfolactate dehydrogenase
MARIVIAEFMDAAAVAQLARRHDVLYDVALVDDGARLYREAPSGPTR